MHNFFTGVTKLHYVLHVLTTFNFLELPVSKKILVLNGSPHHKGNTALLCKNFVDGVTNAGHEVMQFDLQGMKIAGCIGCMRGGKDPESPCTIKDDMGLIYPVYEKADIVVLASPLYYWAFTGQLKCAFDRLFAVAECNPDYANPVKECILLMAAEGNTPDNWKPVEDYYDSLIHFLKWKNLGKVLAGGVLNPGDIADHPALAEAFKLGSSL